MKVQPHDIRFGVIRRSTGKLVVANLPTRDDASARAAVMGRILFDDIGYIRSSRTHNHLRPKSTPVHTVEEWT